MLAGAQRQLLAGLDPGQLVGLHLRRVRRVEQLAGRAGPAVVVLLDAAGERQHDDQGRGDGNETLHCAFIRAAPSVAPASRCRWVWKIVCPAPAPVLKTRR